MKKIIIDLDGTLTVEDTNLPYDEKLPQEDVIQKLRIYKELGFTIVIHSARNMRTYEGNIGKINVHTLPKILKWLTLHSVPFDEVVIGKPWCGEEGFYVDDRAIRPNEFILLSPDEVLKKLSSK